MTTMDAATLAELRGLATGDIASIRGMVEQCYDARSRYHPRFAQYADKERVCLAPETVTALLDLAEEALRLRAVLTEIRAQTRDNITYDLAMEALRMQERVRQLRAAGKWPPA